MGRPPATEARDTRQEILDAALDLFAERGFFGTSMREIARAVGVRESAIYHHFAKKEALLEAIMAGVGDERLSRFEQQLSQWGDGPVRELLLNVAMGMIERWETPAERKLWRIQMTEGFRLAEEGRFRLDASFDKPRGRLQQLFADLAKAGRIKPVNPALAALEFISPMMMLRHMMSSPHGFTLPAGLAIRDVLAAHINFFATALGA